MTSTDWTTEATGAGAYAQVNGLNLYYETVGSGRPLILLHGGLGSGEMFGPLIPVLAADHRVITVDLQGHGRTADVDRPLDVRLMAGDIAALIELLGLEQADVMGYSLGGGVAMLTAMRHPQLVRKAVCVSAHMWSDATYEEMRAQQGQLNAAAAAFMTDTPMYQLYARVAPRPGDFGRLLDKIGEALAQPFDYREELRSLTVPTLIAAGDADMAPPRHYVEVFELLDGGRRDGGWMGEGRSRGGHALAILPRLTHYSIFSSPLLAHTALAFLDEEVA